MAKLEELVLHLTAENQQLLAKVDETQRATNAAFQKMEKAVEQFSKQGEQSTSRLSRIFDVFAGVTLANVATQVFGLVTGPFKALSAQFQAGVVEAQEYEKANIRLANSLAISGKFTDDAMKSLQEYQNVMEQQTGIDDAVIASNLAVLSSLTRMDSEGLQKAQTSALNLSAALGIDLNTATNLVAKAANGNVGALSRYGIQIQATGDRAKDGANALRILEERFAGAAAGSMQSFGGVITQVRNSIGNFFQALGQAIANNPVIIAGIKSLTAAFNEFAAWASENPMILKQALADLFLFIIEAVTRVIDVMDAVGRAYSFVTTLFETKSLSKAVEASLDTTVLETISNRFKMAGAAAREAFVDMAESGQAVKPTIDSQLKATRELTAAEEERRAKLVQFAQSLIESSNSAANAYTLQTDVFKTQYENDLINFETYKQSKLAAEAAYMEEQRLMLEQAGLTQQEYELAFSQLSREQGLQRLKTQQELARQEEAINQRKLQGFSQFFGNLSALQHTNSRELFAIGKAAALAQATIDGAAAIQGAYKTGAVIGGPALGAAFAAAAGAATAVNVAKIASTGLRRGIDSVPGVGTQDNFPAMLAPGERVVPTKTNEDLTAFLQRMDDRQMDQQVVFNLNFNGPVWADKASAGSEIIDAINEAIDRGMGLRLRNA